MFSPEMGGVTPLREQVRSRGPWVAWVTSPVIHPIEPSGESPGASLGEESTGGTTQQMSPAVYARQQNPPGSDTSRDNPFPQPHPVRGGSDTSAIECRHQAGNRNHLGS